MTKRTAQRVIEKTFDLGTERARRSGELRRAILTASVKMLARGGPEALNMRDVGAAVGATTKVVYSHFGGKPGLIAEIYADGFGRLAQAMHMAAGAARTSRRKLEQAARAYRDFALCNSEVFHLMYGPAIKSLAPSVSDRAAAAPSLQVLIDEYEAQGLSSAAARNHARGLWAAIHGPIMLELTGWLFDGEADMRFEEALRAALNRV
jgi:AcrR family transcriptional regulator